MYQKFRLFNCCVDHYRDVTAKGIWVVLFFMRLGVKLLEIPMHKYFDAYVFFSLEKSPRWEYRIHNECMFNEIAIFSRVTSLLPFYLSTMSPSKIWEYPFLCTLVNIWYYPEHPSGPSGTRLYFVYPFLAHSFQNCNFFCPDRAWLLPVLILDLERDIEKLVFLLRSKQLFVCKKLGKKNPKMTGLRVTPYGLEYSYLYWNTAWWDLGWINTTCTFEWWQKRQSGKQCLVLLSKRKGKKDRGRSGGVECSSWFFPLAGGAQRKVLFVWTGRPLCPGLFHTALSSETLLWFLSVLAGFLAPSPERCEASEPMSVGDSELLRSSGLPRETTETLKQPTVTHFGLPFCFATELLSDIRWYQEGTNPTRKSEIAEHLNRHHWCFYSL